MGREPGPGRAGGGGGGRLLEQLIPVVRRIAAYCGLLQVAEAAAGAALLEELIPALEQIEACVCARARAFATAATAATAAISSQ